MSPKLDLTAEEPIIKAIGGELLGSGSDTFSVLYFTPEQRNRLVSELSAIGWHCVHDNADNKGEASALDFSRDPTRTLSARSITTHETIISNPTTGYKVAVFFAFLLAGLLWSYMQPTLRMRDSGVAIILMLLIAPLFIYGGLKSASQKIRFLPDSIVISNFFQRITLPVTFIESWKEEKYESRNGWYFSIIFTLKDHAAHKVIVLQKNIATVENEIKRRYDIPRVS